MQIQWNEISLQFRSASFKKVYYHIKADVCFFTPFIVNGRILEHEKKYTFF